MPTIDRSQRGPLKPRARPKSKRKYQPDAVRAAFARWQVGAETPEGEQRLYCPLCEDPATSQSPSASMNAESGEWYCQKGEHGGSVHDLVQKLGLKVDGTVSRSSVRPKPRVLLPPELEDQEKPYNWHDQMIAKFPDQLDYLMTQRGLSLETVERFKLGWDGQRFTIPIRYKGRWRAVRRYLPNSKKKMLNLLGHGTAMLAFTEELPGNTLPVILTEGELDSLLTNDKGAGVLVAVTGTGGAGTPPRDLSMLAGREVFIAYDADDAGRAGAAKILPLLQAEGAQAHILDLTRLGLRPTESGGEDLTDFFMKRGGTVARLLAEMTRLREGADDGRDEVLAAVERMFLASDETRRDYSDTLMSDDEIMALAPPTFIIDGWIPRGFYTDFFGEPGAMKTFALLDMLRCIRAGIPWHGHAVTQGAVLLFEGEGLEQLQGRILAWNEHHDDPALVSGASTSTFVDLTRPEGVAAVIRTVRDFEQQTGEQVVAVTFDPIVEYMTGEENGEGMDMLTRGLRTLAQYLNIGVPVGHHTNASGDRARGADFLRMRAGAHVRVEKLDGGLIGLVQEKQKNAAPRAVILRPEPVGPSLVLTTEEQLSAAEYAGRKTATALEQRTTIKLSVAKASRTAKNSTAEQLFLDAVMAQPGLSQGKLLSKCKGNGIGHDVLLAVLDDLVNVQKRIRVEIAGNGERAAHRHFLAEETQ